MYDSLRYANDILTTQQRNSSNGSSPPTAAGDGGNNVMHTSATNASNNSHNSSSNSNSSSNTSGLNASGYAEELLGAGNILCTHDGVLLKRASAEYIADLNTSGSLSLVEYGVQPRRILCIEWRPNENILIADDSQDQGDWALVDTISQRTRTISECKAFNVKPTESTLAGQSAAARPKVVRIRLEDVASIEIRHRGQVMRLLRKCEGAAIHSEFFFQHGNAEVFVNGMRHQHIIEPVGQVARSTSGVDEYIVLTKEKQKLSKTFAELDIGQIKATRVDGEHWLTTKVFGFIGQKLPDSTPHTRPAPLVHGSRQKHDSGGGAGGGSSNSASVENYQMVGLTCSASSESRASSLDKSPVDSELENVKEEDEKIINTLPERQVVLRGAPLNEMQWLEFHTSDGRISDPTRIREIIFRGGIEPQLRADVWKYLLNYNHWDDTLEERQHRQRSKSIEYYNMKAQWLSMTTVQEANFSGYRDRKCQIEKDVKRTDRTLDFYAGEDNPNLLLLQGILMTYVMYNFDLGYVQGMSDLLAPILAIQDNEVDAFWCFAGFMELVYGNFDIDQAGMKTQFNQLRRLLEFANPRLFNYMITHDSDNMYFCFRWLLVWYKREFENDDVLKLWECLWTHLPCPNFHIFISVAILDQETDIIIESKYEFNEILKHVNELSCNIDLQHTLKIAEAIYLQVKSAEHLPNEIRQIIGEPLLDADSPNTTHDDGSSEPDFEDGFDVLVNELTPAERQRKQELLEEACERSMFLTFM